MIETCPICEGKLHPRVYHSSCGAFRLRKMIKYSKCDKCKSEIGNYKQSRYNVARGTV